MPLVISEYKVMQSAAGFYIGRSYNKGRSYNEDGFDYPYDRASHYYETKEDAERYLEYIREAEGI